MGRLYCHRRCAPERKITVDDRSTLNRNLAQMLKGGVIMDVTDAEQAKIAQEAGAVAVMALERVPADIPRQGGVARMSDPKTIKEIQAAVTIPVMATRSPRRRAPWPLWPWSASPPTSAAKAEWPA